MRRPGRLVLLGHPVAHSLSPAFQNAALRSAGIPLVYEALDVPPEALAATLDTLRRERAAGNATIPHKESLLDLCDRRTPLAERVGAANTFWVDDDGAVVGDNTDVGGVDAAVRALLGEVPPGARVALLGAGGAAAAALAAAERWPGAEVALWNRTRARAERLRARFPTVRLAASPDEAVRDATLVVNATAVGLGGDEMPVAVTALPGEAAVLDLVYRPGETAWVRAARGAGHRAADGLTMLVEQGALAFERWLGTPPDRDAMWRALGMASRARHGARSS